MHPSDILCCKCHQDTSRASCNAKGKVYCFECWFLQKDWNCELKESDSNAQTVNTAIADPEPDTEQLQLT